MRVYLIQHGKAKSKEEDPERGLTGEGRLETRRIADVLSRTAPEVHVIWHSGKLRARETAEIVAEALGIPRRIMEHSNLGPKDDVKLLAGELQGSAHNIVVTGHLPFLAGLAGFMLTGNLEAEPVEFRNSGVVCLERDKDGWTLKWAMTPELFPQ